MKKINFLLTGLLISWVVLATACQNENHLLHSKGQEPSSLSLSKKILPQRNRIRKFSSNTLELIKEINFENLEKPPYRPTYLLFDEQGALYTVDFSEFYIHKFLPSSGWKNFKHFYFGKGKGQGPGELSRVLDFKVFRGELYLADEGTGSIEVYSTEGMYKKRITLSNNLIPRKITLQDGKIIVESLTLNAPLFYVYDLSGNMIYSFGELINKTSRENFVYQDNTLSDSFSGNCFYYLPRFLGFVVLYQGDKLTLAKETIDGINTGKKNIPVKKTIMEGVVVQTVSKKIETVSLHALHEDFILIKTYDYEKKKTFWDIYTINDFNYQISIKNPPLSKEVAIHKDYIAVLTDTETGSEIRLFDMTKVLFELHEQKRGNSR